jgi:hypothetical protein
VSGVGADKVDVATDQYGRPLRETFGTGRLWGNFAVVVNADNMVDAPEYVVMTGTFRGDMFLTAPAEFKGKKQSAGGPATQRIVLANGVFTPENILGWTPEQLAGGMKAPVEALGLGSATFSGVFRLPFSVAKGHKEKPRRDGSDAYYLDDTDTLIKLRKNETALGYPTVRIEVNFGR